MAMPRVNRGPLSPEVTRTWGLVAYGRVRTPVRYTRVRGLARAVRLVSVALTAGKAITDGPDGV